MFEDGAADKEYWNLISFTVRQSTATVNLLLALLLYLNW